MKMLSCPLFVAALLALMVSLSFVNYIHVPADIKKTMDTDDFEANIIMEMKNELVPESSETLQDNYDCSLDDKASLGNEIAFFKDPKTPCIERDLLLMINQLDYLPRDTSRFCDGIRDMASNIAIIDSALSSLSEESLRAFYIIESFPGGVVQGIKNRTNAYGCFLDRAQGYYKFRALECREPPQDENVGTADQIKAATYAEVIRRSAKMYARFRLYGRQCNKEAGIRMTNSMCTSSWHHLNYRHVGDWVSGDRLTHGWVPSRHRRRIQHRWESQGRRVQQLLSHKQVCIAAFYYWRALDEYWADLGASLTGFGVPVKMKKNSI